MKYFLSFLFSLFTCANTYTYVEDLDLVKYQGTWYEVYDDLFDESFQKGGSCVRADYSINEQGTVDVLNREVNKKGEIESIVGVAYYDEGNTGGDLTVDLEGTPYPAPYWVIGLGPIVDDLYDYSIVSDNMRLSLFILARNVSRFLDIYEDSVMDFVYDMGFTHVYNMPKLVNQTNCPF